MEERKRRRGDRKDAYLVRDADSMHRMMPYMLPNRTDNEAVMNEPIDLAPIIAYLEKKNVDGIDFKYTFFHVICAAMAKVLALRPLMNRFYAGHRYYERKDIIFSFVVKKQFTDHAKESICMVKFDRESDVSPLEQVYSRVKNFVHGVRKEEKSTGTEDAMATLLKLPRPLLRCLVRFLGWLEYHGWYPSSLMRDDPYYTSVFLSNLGSIKMHASYHHLANWGTNSLFVVIGEKKISSLHQPDGSIETREVLPLGITVDERIADGVYFANSIKLLRKLLADPSLLDLPINTPVEY